MKKRLALTAMLLVTVILLQGCLNTNNYYVTDTTDGQTLNNATPVTGLAKYISEAQNYIADYKLTENNASQSENIKYFVDGELFKKVYNEGTVEKTEYSFVGSGEGEYYFSSDGEFYKLSRDSEYYGRFFMDFYGFDGIDADAFEKTGDGEWSAKPDKCSRQAKFMLGDLSGEEFTSFTLKAENGVITKAVMRANYVHGSNKTERLYEITFSSHGRVELELPEAKELIGDEYLKYADRDSLIYYGGYNGTPTKGSPKLLVVPICFEGESFSQSELSGLNTALCGTSFQTGWHSVSSYYKQSSGGALELTFTVTEPYVCEYSSSYYERLYADWAKGRSLTAPIDIIMSEVISSLDDGLDFSDYDSDSDGFIDGIYLVYSHATEYVGMTSLWWSWSSSADIDVRYDGVFAGEYVWAGIDTLDELLTSHYIPHQNATTLIHETGHMLGLRDYYDTNPSVGTSGGFGGGDMMDGGVGDHCPASKIILDWADVKEVSTDGSYTLKAYQGSNQCIVIKKDNAQGFDCEYIVIDLYSPTGLYQATSGVFGLPTQVGVRICHVDATLLDDRYGLFFATYAANNSTTEHKFIKLIEADGRNDIDKSTESNPVYSENSDLFTVGDEFGQGYTWYDGTPLGFTLSIDGISLSTATVTVTFGD